MTESVKKAGKKSIFNFNYNLIVWYRGVHKPHKGINIQFKCHYDIMTS